MFIFGETKTNLDMNLTIKPCPELTELSKVTGLTENELSKKIIHILDKDLHCIEHWTDAGMWVIEILSINELSKYEFIDSLSLAKTKDNIRLVNGFQLWGIAEHPCELCGCETEIDHTEDIKFCVNPDCDFKETTDHTDYDFKRKFNKENNWSKTL